MKKALRETQTLRAGCSKAKPKIFAPPQTPFQGARAGQNLISRRWSLHLPTNQAWRGSMHAISSYRGNRPTNTHKQTNPQTGPITIHCAAKLSAQCKKHDSDVKRSIVHVDRGDAAKILYMQRIRIETSNTGIIPSPATLTESPTPALKT